MNSNTNPNETTFDPYLTWLGIRDPQRPPNHYRLLGLELFENDPEVIASAADRQMTYVRTYQAGQQGEHSQRLLTELTTAKLCLLKPERKRDYDNRLQAAQKPAPPPPPQPPQVRPPAPMPTMYPAAQQPRPLPPTRPIPQAVPGSAYQDKQLPLGSQPVSLRTQHARPAKNSVQQWSIVGGLVVAAVILAVVLANKYGSNETPVVADNKTTPKVTPTAAKNPPITPNSVTPAETNGQSQGVPETTAPGTTTIGTAEPNNDVATNEPANPPKLPATNSEKQRPGPVKAPLPNVALPGTEEPATPTPSPMNPVPMNPVPMNPAPTVTPSDPTVPGKTVPATIPATAAPSTVATNNDPLNNLPTSSGNNPTTPAPMPLGNPANPLAMPNPLDVPAPNNDSPKPAAPRRPVPSGKEIAESRVNVREVFKNDYTSRDTNTLVSLGKRLLKLAQESSDKPAMMYTTFDEARNVSVQVNDLETTFTAHQHLCREFDIDKDKDLIETVKLAAKNAATINPENAIAVLDLISESINKAILEQHLDTAEQLLRSVSNFTARIPSFDKANREIAFREVQKRIGEHKSFATKAKEFKETLAKNPNDGEANLELGKFWAFQQGNFEAGLNYLAKGSDPEISETAKRELTLKPDASEYVKIAEGWWEIAGKLPPDPRGTVKIHAACIYARALPTLKALDRGLAESRINETFKLFKPNNRDVKELLQLLLTRTTWNMEWTSRSSHEPKLTFSPSGSCSYYAYPNWKLLDNYYVVCYREQTSNSPMYGPFGRFGNNNNNDNGNNPNNNLKVINLEKNVMQIAVRANLIDVRVLGSDGSLRGKGIGTPE